MRSRTALFGKWAAGHIMHACMPSIILPSRQFKYAVGKNRTLAHSIQRLAIFIERRYQRVRTAASMSLSPK